MKVVESSRRINVPNDIIIFNWVEESNVVPTDVLKRDVRSIMPKYMTTDSFNINWCWRKSWKECCIGNYYNNCSLATQHIYVSIILAGKTFT